MNIEVKNSVKSIDYSKSMKILEKRAHDVFLGKKDELLWVLEHNRVYTAGASSKNIDLLDKNIKVIIGKPGLDGHDRGAKIVARALRDAGMEVVYTGIRQTPELIAETALQEDADAIGLSILSGAHLELFPRVVQELEKRDMDKVLLFAGGIIPQEDVSDLEKLGFMAVFGPGSTTQDIVQWIQQEMDKRS